MALGANFLIKKRISGHLNSKGFLRDVFLMTQATQKEQATVPEFETKFTERLHVIMLIIEKTSAGI